MSSQSDIEEFNIVFGEPDQINDDDHNNSDERYQMGEIQAEQTIRYVIIWMKMKMIKE